MITVSLLQASRQPWIVFGLLPHSSLLLRKAGTTRRCIPAKNFRSFYRVQTLWAACSNNGDDREIILNLESEKNGTATDAKESIGVALSRRKFVAWTTSMAILSNFYHQKSAYASSTFDPVNIPGNDVAYEEAILPYSSVRNFKSVTLSNGMQVLLVQDKFASRSTAALTIRGAGQFSDPEDLGGLAHLMEHMTLSARRRFSLLSSRRTTLDFEEWLNEYDASSNGFTAYEKVCFHFMSPSDVFQEALQRFSALFLEETIQRVCRSDDTLRREIRRVNSELDYSNVNTGFLYPVKSLFNEDHPYSRFSAGNLQSLEVHPTELGIDVGERLIEFFHEHYLPSKSILVAVSPSDLTSMEAWVAPFASTLSTQRVRRDNEDARDSANAMKREFPEPFPKRNRISPICLFRRKSKSGNGVDDKFEKLSFLWPLSFDYSMTDPSQQVVTASQIGFVLAQIFGRRGPGSIYNLLRRRKWVPDGTNGIPRISFPVDVSGFQLMKLQLTLTLEGFSSRSAVIAAVYKQIQTLESSNPLSNFPFTLKRNLLSQYATVAQLYGSVLAPRPPDAVELAFDAQIYGVEGVSGCQWRRFPFPQDYSGILGVQRCLSDTLKAMNDPTSAIIIVTASAPAIKNAQTNVFDDSLPKMSPASWNIEQRTGARYFFENPFRLSGRVNEWLVARLMEDELSPPKLDNLILSMVPPPRARLDKTDTSDYSRPFVLADSSGSQESHVTMTRMITRSPVQEVGIEVPSRTSIVRDYWAILQVMGQNPLPLQFLPRAPPEPSCRSVFVLQLLSARPARARVEMAAHAELWRVSFEYATEDLVRANLSMFLLSILSGISHPRLALSLGRAWNIGRISIRLELQQIRHAHLLSWIKSEHSFVRTPFEPSHRCASEQTSGRSGPIAI